MTGKMTGSTIEVRKDNWGETRVLPETWDETLADDEVLLKVDRLALTANNISYANAGDTLGYWGFFPTEPEWGRIPAMGWGEVVASAHPDVVVGERIWGWFPFSNYLKIRAGKVSASRITDVSPHRAEYAPVYAQYDRASASPIYDPAREDHDSLLRGLFMTSWLVEDFLTVNDSFGGKSCLITSASSKTSISLAYCVRQRGALTSIGITSPGNVDFCESLGCYDRVLTYDDVASLDASQPAVLVDMAGNAKVLSDIHHHYRDNLMHSCRIGATHYDETGSTKDLPGPRAEFFFAPTHVKTRGSELGAKEFMFRMGTAFVGFRDFANSWLSVKRSCGIEAVTETYQAVLGGKTDPASGQIISLWPEGDS